MLRHLGKTRIANVQVFRVMPGTTSSAVRGLGEVPRGLDTVAACARDDAVVRQTTRGRLEIDAHEHGIGFCKAQGLLRNTGPCAAAFFGLLIRGKWVVPDATASSLARHSRNQRHHAERDQGPALS